MYTCHYCDAKCDECISITITNNEALREYEFCDMDCGRAWLREDELPSVQKATTMMQEIKIKKDTHPHPFICNLYRLSVADLMFAKACHSRKNIQRAMEVVIRCRREMFDWCDENRNDKFMKDEMLMYYSDLLKESSLHTLNLIAEACM
jgi:hypothetical protein